MSNLSVMIWLCVCLCHRYRAVASWSRVQGVGIPLFTVIEIVSIWVLSLVLAVPEAIGFDMVSFNYRNETIRTCMLYPKTDFMLVCIHPSLIILWIRNLQLSASVSNCYICFQAKMCYIVHSVKVLVQKRSWILQ